MCNCVCELVAACVGGWCSAHRMPYAANVRMFAKLSTLQLSVHTRTHTRSHTKKNATQRYLRACAGAVGWHFSVCDDCVMKSRHTCSRPHMRPTGESSAVCREILSSAYVERIFVHSEERVLLPPWLCPLCVCALISRRNLERRCADQNARRSIGRGATTRTAVQRGAYTRVYLRSLRMRPRNWVRQSAAQHDASEI